MYKTKTIIRIISLPVLLMLTFLAFFLLSSQQVSAQTTTIECDTGRFLSQNQTNTQLNFLNFNVSPATLTPIGSPTADGYNAIGYRIADMYLYGYDMTNTQFVRIDGGGVATLIGNGTTPVPSNSWAAGDIDADGDHNMLSFVDSVGTGNINTWVITDVSGVPATIDSFVLTNDIAGGLAVGDFAFNPADGKFYGIDTVTNQAVMIDITKAGAASSGTVTHFGPVHSFTGSHGAAYINSKGQLITVQNNPGRLYRVDVGINGNGSGAATLLSNSPNVNQNDGASCPVVPLIEKVASPEEIEQGGTVTYTYTIYNPLQSQALTFDFLDDLEDGFTYIADSLSDDLGGTPNNYGGTGTLSIGGMTIAAGGTASFTVDVAVADDAPVGLTYNQACINNFNFATLVNEVCSDYPVSPIFGDPTPLTVLPPAAPDTGYEIFEQNPAYILGLTSVISLAIVIIARRLRAAKVS